MDFHRSVITTPTMSTELLQATATGVVSLVINVNIDPRYLKPEDVRPIEKGLQSGLRQVLLDDPDTRGKVLVVANLNAEWAKQNNYIAKKKSIAIEAHFNLTTNGDWKTVVEPTAREILKSVEAKILEVLLSQGQLIIPYTGKQLTEERVQVDVPKPRKPRGTSKSGYVRVGA
jgi:hypothetical protein